MTAILLLLLIGVVDVARSSGSRRRAAIVATLAAVLVAVVALWALAAPLWSVAAAGVAAAAWVIAMPSNDRPRPRNLWPPVILGGLLAIAALADAAPLPASPLRDLYGSVAPTPGPTFDSLVAGVAVILFLTRSANLITRAALGRARRADEALTPPRAGWSLRVGGRSLATVQPERAAAHPVGPELRGGRVIGPLERLLIVALALGGAQVLIAALVAAKGVVRFPEISQDRGSGSKAEEFLVGSLTSWAMSAAAVAYLSFVAR